MRSFYSKLLVASCFLLLTAFAWQQEPWAKDELMAPAELVDKLRLGKTERPTVFNIGPEGQIRTAIRIGPVNYEEGMEKFRSALLAVPRNREVVIYCGCCTVQNCPNIRPAFRYLKKAGYARARVLNIATNLHKDWTSKGYPLD